MRAAGVALRASKRSVAGVVALFGQVLTWGAKRATFLRLVGCVPCMGRCMPFLLKHTSLCFFAGMERREEH